MDEAKPVSLARRLMRAGIPKSHAYQIANGPTSVAVAIRVYRRTQIKVGPIAEASDEEIETLDKYHPVESGAAA